MERSRVFFLIIFQNVPTFQRHNNMATVIISAYIFMWPKFTLLQMNKGCHYIPLNDLDKIFTAK